MFASYYPNAALSARVRLLAASLSVLLPMPLVLPVLGHAAAAQSVGAISGTVRDSAGTPIRGVEVVVLQMRRATYSDSVGAFRFADVESGKRQLHFRRLGFAPKSVDADINAGETVALAIVLSPVATEIEGMTVEESSRRRRLLSEFYDRKARGFGHFITREDIESRNPANLSDMMRMVPGARVISSRVGGTGTVRFNRALMAPGRDCPPQYWVDGVKTWGFNIDDVLPSDVEGIEIYPGASTVPPQYNTKEGTTICGVILIWTRIP
jgi:hypothetical protein